MYKDILSQQRLFNLRTWQNEYQGFYFKPLNLLELMINNSLIKVTLNLYLNLIVETYLELPTNEEYFLVKTCKFPIIIDML